MEEIINFYYKNNAIILRKLVDKILRRFGEVADRDEFYSLANEVFVEVLEKYDTSRPFEVFLYSCLCNRIKSEFRRQSRKKRMTERFLVSMDMPLEDAGGLMLADTLASHFDLESEVIEKDSWESEKVQQYFWKLSKRQRAVARLLADSYKAGEVQKMLHLTRKEYSDALTGIRSYQNVSVLFTELERL